MTASKESLMGNELKEEDLINPPIHPKFPQKFSRKEVERNVSIQQSIEDMSDFDKDFMYQQRKNNLHRERLLTAHLRLIRKYSFLPKGIHTETYNHALKHVYTDLEFIKREERKAIKRMETQIQEMDETELQEIEAIANQISQEN